MFTRTALALAGLLLHCTNALRYDQAFVGYNLNENENAVEPRDYTGSWGNHTHHPSPENWRFPFYVLTIDRFVDGDPSNNDANHTVFEHDWLSNQFRFGGDVAGVHSDLDYIQGLGARAIYFTGSMMLNMPWSPDGYGPLDFTLLDQHHGTIEEWRALIADIHDRGMYVIFDNTMATMGNLLGYAEPYTNATAEFKFGEYDYIWKDPERRYHDFQPSNEVNKSCQLPRIWEQNGFLEPVDVLDQFQSCRASEFDMYGDIATTGAYPSYVNQFSRFGSVQDRLREWQPEVLEKINIMSCMQITMLDIDGFRMDKGVQTTIDAMADFSTYQRECARQVGKENFLMVGEVVADPKLSAVYFGRGKQPDQALSDASLAVHTSNTSDAATYIRPFGKTALDGAAFHYDIYGSLTRFLGLDGPWGTLGVDWVYLWNTMLTDNDLVNANTGLFDPRHMFGTTNQDVFRWPALANGTQRQLLGQFVTTLELPGIPMLLYGEEQESYILENLAADYVFGRTPMASSRAWQLHGCYGLGEELYVDMPFDRSAYGCHDDAVSRDHRDPSHPMHNIIKRMYEARLQYPVLNDGFNLTTLSTRIYDLHLRGSQGMPSPTGLWSVYRGRNEAVQDFTGTGAGNQPVWLLFQNENRTVDYEFDCASTNSSAPDGSLVSAFAQGTRVKNLFYPYDEYDLSQTAFSLGLEDSTEANGCIPRISFAPWEFKAFVPVDAWQQPRPVITRVLPGHDARLESSVGYDQTESVGIQVRFSAEMDCDSVADSLLVESTTQTGQVARLNRSSVVCTSAQADAPQLSGQVATEWIFTAELENVANGVHTYTVVNATTADGDRFTNARDKFMFRLGQIDNPMVFPDLANYTRELLHRDASGALYIAPRAAGAERFRYSTNWGSSYSTWQTYTGDNVTLQELPWSGAKHQEWDEEHVIVNYWSRMAGSAQHVQHGDLSWPSDKPPRRWPHAWVEGVFNQWGSDSGIKNKMSQNTEGNWTFDLFTEWPTNVLVNVWGMNPDGLPDKSAAYGDVDRDGVLDWIPPDSLANNVINISAAPTGHLGYRMQVNDGTFGYSLVPYGSQAAQIVAMVLLCLVPVLTAGLGVWAYLQSFYQVKFNKIGAQSKRDFLTMIPGVAALRKQFFGRTHYEEEKAMIAASANPSSALLGTGSVRSGPSPTAGLSEAVAADAGSPDRRSVLIATMEYEIPEYNVKIKIGGLGVMASLMGKNLTHQNLIWVVPCAGGIDYPFEAGSSAPSMRVTILDEVHKVSVYYHVSNNITYVLLDAPVFRQRTKDEPYPARMDDLESGIYYSAWNQCVAEAIRRFKPDLYHINDYHGACAPLYLLPEVIPCCLSLHNAEFQGQWPLRTADQMRETCRVFNLPQEVVKKYVQFGEVFNLLHAAASYLRIHQSGFGAVGVSKKYGKRSLARYPIFWGLDHIGALPNPDPADTAPWDKTARAPEAKIDAASEEQRAAFRVKAQEWAGLNVDPKAELFIFVGRWSMQKGIDLIADVFPSVLANQANTQLICVGPVIDLYGKFAALKLDKLMAQYPGRVFSKPEFTALPPYIFSGAEFALMPSRDEPFGLVAVEFGRKGALCVGARVGGFGHMPGWWFTVESVTPKHLLNQFKSAISAALTSDTETRALMRAYSMLQRFPVLQWVEDLEILQSESVRQSVKGLTRSDMMTRLRSVGSSLSLLSQTTHHNASGMPGTPMSLMSPATMTPALMSPAGSRAPSLTRWGGRSGFNSAVQTPTVHSPAISRQNSAENLRGRSQAQSEAASSTDPARLLVSRHPHLPAVSENYGDGIFQQPDPAHLTVGGPPDLSKIESALDDAFKRLDVGDIMGANNDSSLQKNMTPMFNDSRNIYYKQFSQKLDKLNPKVSENKLCIEEYIMDSEKDWFIKYHNASLRKGPAFRAGSRTPSLSGTTVRQGETRENSLDLSHSDVDQSDDEYHQILGSTYKAPRGIRRLLQVKIGNWYLYCFLLAFGQIISASSYQLTLLTGSVGQPANKLYTLSTIYLVASFSWWFLYRRVQAVWCLSGPFLFFGATFFFLGLGVVTSNEFAKGWIFNTAAGLYAIGSSAGSLYFSLNFGTEGGTPSKTWAFRACVIAGTQQLLIAFLWYWGSYLTRSDVGGIVDSVAPSSATLTAVAMPLAVLMWAIGIVLFLGLPSYYRQKPGAVPSFYRALCKRGIVLWFWVMVVLQSYWLSAPYSRNWLYLWSSTNAPRWAVALLIIFFFVIVWAAGLFVLGRLSKQHTWIIPIFAIGLGAPRWCQMLWATSGVGYHIPWAGLVGGALLGRVVWLWLGVLDALQGVGFGMILLMTLTRTHIAFTLVAAQMIGAFFTILARLTAPNNVGPGSVFLNVASDSLAHVWFWIGLLCQLLICVGYFKFFRKAQLTKP